METATRRHGIIHYSGWTFQYSAVGKRSSRQDFSKGIVEPNTLPFN